MVLNGARARVFAFSARTLPRLRFGQAAVLNGSTSAVADVVPFEGPRLRRSRGAQHPDRNAQFEYINRLAGQRLASGEPVISVDCKKKEVSATPNACAAQQLLGNTGFETGTAAPWSATSGVISNNSTEPAHTGSSKAWLDGYGTTHTYTLSQPVTLPHRLHQPHVQLLHAHRHCRDHHNHETLLDGRTIHRGDEGYRQRWAAPCATRR
jgi:hypothetical protein